MSTSEKTRVRQLREVRNPVYLAFAKIGGGWRAVKDCSRAVCAEPNYRLDQTHHLEKGEGAMTEAKTRRLDETSNPIHTLEVLEGQFRMARAEPLMLSWPYHPCR